MTDAVDLPTLLSLPESETLDFKAKGYDVSNRQHRRDFAKDIASMIPSQKPVLRKFQRFSTSERVID